MGLKIGANKSDQKRIREHFEKGYKAEEISARLLICLKTVTNFTPDKQEKGKEKVKAANAKAGKEHKEIMDSKKSNPVNHQPPPKKGK